MKQIEDILALVDKEFDEAICDASDEVWELYDEAPSGLLKYISLRDRLDTLSIKAKTWSPAQWVDHERWKSAVEQGLTSEPFQTNKAYIMHYTSMVDVPEERKKQIEAIAKQPRTATIIFGPNEASLICIVAPNDLIWVQDFLVALKNRIGRPTGRQILSRNRPREFHVGMPFAGSVAVDVAQIPYSLIRFKQPPPKPFVENVKANIFSNILWIVAIAVVGYLLGRFGLPVPDFLK